MDLESRLPRSRIRAHFAQLTHILFCALSASETRLLLAVKLNHNVVMTGIKIMHQVIRLLIKN